MKVTVEWFGKTVALLDEKYFVCVPLRLWLLLQCVHDPFFPVLKQKVSWIIELKHIGRVSQRVFVSSNEFPLMVWRARIFFSSLAVCVVVCRMFVEYSIWRGTNYHAEIKNSKFAQKLQENHFTITVFDLMAMTMNHWYNSRHSRTFWCRVSHKYLWCVILIPPDWNWELLHLESRSSESCCNVHCANERQVFLYE